MTKEEIHYDFDIQKVYLDFLISDPTAYVRTRSILKAEHWHEKLRPAVRYLIEYADEQQVIPTPQQIKAFTKVDLDLVMGIQNEHTEWLLNEVESFTRHRAMEMVIMNGADAVAEGKYASIEEQLKDALSITLSSDLGTTYWDTPEERIRSMLDRDEIRSTGWKTLDDLLYGGFTKGALNVFAGGSGCVVAGTKVRIVKILDI